MSPKVVKASAPSRPASPEASSYDGPVSRALLVAGLIYLVGSLVDLGILWLGQRQPGLQWEFVAITNTVESWPRMVLAIGLLYAGLHIGKSTSTAAYRVLAGALLLLGLAALAMAGLMFLNYLQVVGNMQGDGLALVRSSVVKTELLSALYVVTLIPVGVLGLRLGSRS